MILLALEFTTPILEDVQAQILSDQGPNKPKAWLDLYLNS